MQTYTDPRLIDTRSAVEGVRERRQLGGKPVRRQTLLFAAVAWHLDHPPAPRASALANRARWQDSVRLRRTRCKEGIDGHRDD